MTRLEKIAKVEQAFTALYERARAMGGTVPVTARTLAQVAVDAIGKPSALDGPDEFEIDGRMVL